MSKDSYLPAKTEVEKSVFPFTFTIEGRCAENSARAGALRTPHGEIHTPIFMPVGTQASVKSLSPAELSEVGAEIILANTYHLNLRPGADLIAEFGGLHGFMKWNKPVLTDSGGFQVFSLGHMRHLGDDGVRFKSHLDGSEVYLTPESVIEIEEKLGADIILPLDECASTDYTLEQARAAMERTHRWAERALKAKSRPDQALFGIPQGWFDPALRIESAKFIGSLPFDGFSIGGLSVGESKETMWSILKVTVPVLPDNKPRHLLGVGSPEDLIEGIALGIDMFDCVFPTRVARNGALFTSQGRVNIRASRFRAMRGPVEPGCDCTTCTEHDAAYLHHLARAGELLYYRLATIHNLHFVLHLVKTARNAILQDAFPDFYNDFKGQYIPASEKKREEQRQKWLQSRSRSQNE